MPHVTPVADGTPGAKAAFTPGGTLHGAAFRTQHFEKIFCLHSSVAQKQALSSS